MATGAGSSKVTFQNRFLRVDVDVKGVTWQITDKATGAVFRMAKSTDQDVVLEDDKKQRTHRALASSQDKAVFPNRNGVPGLYLRLLDLGLGVQLSLNERDLEVEIERLTGTGPARVRDLLFPRHFLLPKKSDAYSTWTVGQGSIVPANTTSRFHHPEGYSEQEMCWHGAYQDGCGAVAIAETPFDLYIAMSHLPGEAPGTFIHWLPSHGDLRYTRRVRFTFEKGLTFVKQAKHYRAWAKRAGYFVSLKEKARWNPNIARLKGAAVINSLTCIRRVRTMGYEMNTFADQAKWATSLRKATGLKNAVVHVDGWGKFGYDSVHPETLPPNAEAGGPKGLKSFRESVRDSGWLFALHDQYIDIYADAPSYHPSRFMVRENGRPNTLNVWAGGLCSHLCVSESLKFLRRNFVEGVKDQYMYHNSPPIYAICEPDAYYLDCFCRIHECFNPEHPLTRAEVVHYTTECHRTVRNHGKKVVLSDEHPKFYAVPDLDFGWGISHLKADVQVVGGGNATELIGIPVPLWHLVFHDALWLPDYGENYLQQMLYGSGVYLTNKKDLPKPEELAMKKKVLALNDVIGFDEMVDFEVIGGGQAFRSSFESGVRVTTSPAEKTYAIEGARSVATKGSVKLG
ncbi:MAG: hypothetical protein KIS92_14190 [Planctomycetota bacterium]|nr:hypothetical protein [Planctomycetota bacterium]